MKGIYRNLLTQFLDELMFKNNIVKTFKKSLIL
jgi:hypothetical protein